LVLHALARGWSHTHAVTAHTHPRRHCNRTLPIAATQGGTSPAVPRKATTKTAGTKGHRLKTATVSARPPPSRNPASKESKPVDKNKVTTFEDRTVAKRNAALNAMGGMKVGCAPHYALV
jgi:hypothetical protein